MGEFQHQAFSRLRGQRFATQRDEDAEVHFVTSTRSVATVLHRTFYFLFFFKFSSPKVRSIILKPDNWSEDAAEELASQGLKVIGRLELYSYDSNGPVAPDFEKEMEYI
jgi:hypothetical protein